MSGISVNRIPKKFALIISAGSGFIGAAAIAYFYFLQVPAVISGSRLLIAAIVGLATAGMGFLAVRRKSRQELSETLRRYWLAGLFVLFFCLPLIPVPQNYLLAPKMQLQVEIQGHNQPGEIVDITWIHSGLGDISFKNVQLENPSVAGEDSIQLVLDQNSSTRFTWSGRAWKEMTILVRSDVQPYQVSAVIQPAGQKFDFLFDSSGEQTLSLPIGKSSYYNLINSIIYLGWLCAGIFIFLAVPWKKLATLVKAERSRGSSPAKPGIFANVFEKIAHLPDGVWLAILCAGVFAGFVLTQQPGHYWSGDYARYLEHGFNIANLRPYAETRYIFNPQNNVGPIAYPPGYPALIAPILAIFGLNWGILKAFNALVFGLTLVMIYILSRRHFSRPLLWLLLILVAAQPIYFLWKNYVLSDLPFTLFFIGALAALDNFVQARRYSWQTALVGGILIYGVYAIRSIGIVLLPALLLTMLIKERKLNRWLVGVIAISAGLIFLQSILLPGINYLENLSISLKSILNYGGIAASNFKWLWQTYETSPIQTAFVALMFCFMMIGYIRELFKHPGLLEFAFAGYAVITLIWPFDQGTRFFLPIFPLMVYYLFRGLAFLSLYRRDFRQPQPVVLAVLMIVLLRTAVGMDTSYTGIRYSDNIINPEIQSLFGYLRESTDPDDVIAFSYPRNVSFFSQRYSAAVDWSQDDPSVWRYLNSIEADEIALEKSDLKQSEFVRRNPDRLDLVFANSLFEVYKIK